MNTEIDLDTMEAAWPAKAPDVTLEELPETTMAVRAHSLLADKIQLADQIAIRCVELGMTGAVTAENYPKAKTIVGLCRSARGDIERNRKAANADALAWQRAINKRAGELTADVDRLEAPYKSGIKVIDDAEEAERQAKIDAERKAIEDAALAVKAAQQSQEDAKRAEEREVNRIEAERLAKEREQFKAEQATRDAARAAEKIENDRLDAERKAAAALVAQAAQEARDRLDTERRQFEAEKAERNRIDAALKKAEADRLAAEVAEKARLEAAEREKARLEAIRPDVEKVRALGAAIEAVLVPEVASDEARAMIERTIIGLMDIVEDLKDFGANS